MRKTISTRRLRAVEYAAALTLLIAAALKSMSSTQLAVDILPRGMPKYASLLLIEFEVILAVLIVQWPTPTVRFLAGLTFAIFAGISGLSALQGDQSCGCFGAFAIHPALTATLDAIFAIVLLRGLLTQNRFNTTKPTTRALPTLAALLLCVAFVGASWQANMPQHLTEANSSITVISPHDWLGQRFPLAEFCRPNWREQTGTAIVLIYQHDCSTCERVLPAYEAMADNGRKITLIELPPFGDRLGATSAAHRRLTESRQWFAETPVEITLENNVVTAIRDRHALTASGHVN